MRDIIHNNEAKAISLILCVILIITAFTGITMGKNFIVVDSNSTFVTNENNKNTDNIKEPVEGSDNTESSDNQDSNSNEELNEPNDSSIQIDTGSNTDEQGSDDNKDVDESHNNEFQNENSPPVEPKKFIDKEEEVIDENMICSPVDPKPINNQSSYFGFSFEGSSNTNIENRIAGSWGEAIGGDGTADYIKAYLRAVDGYGTFSGLATAGLYSYIADDDAGELILNGQTEEMVITVAENTKEWVQFNFTDPKPTIVNGTKYFCVVSVQDTCGNLKLMAKNNDPGFSIYKMVSYSSILPEHLVNEIGSNYHRSIYCSYTIGPENIPPVAVDDFYNGLEDNVLNIVVPGVLSNDFDLDGPAKLTAILMEKTHHGEIILNENGSFSYMPEKDYFGNDTFVYAAFDSEDYSNKALVTITVNGTQDNPVAINDNVETMEDTQNYIIDVLANDFDVDGDRLRIVNVSEAYHGIVKILPSPDQISNVLEGSKVSYTPNKDYFGDDKFEYTISDGHKGEATAIVYLTIKPVNDDPVAVFDYENILEDSSDNIFDVLANDFDVDGDRLRIVDVSEAYHGKVSIVPSPIQVSNIDDGFKVSYTPNKDYFGEDKFSYKITDGHGGKSEGIVYINIDNVNDPPYAPVYLYPNEGQTDLETDLTLYWTGGDPEGDNVTYEVVIAINNGNSFSEKNITEESFRLDNLDYNTKYFWKVIATDEYGASTEGALWNFTTRNAPIDQGGAQTGGASSPGETNAAPIADASAGEPYQGFIDEAMTFDATNSYDPNGEIVEYYWDFGDGSNQLGEIVTHSFSRTGVFLVTLKVTDNDGAIGIARIYAEIYQGNIPPLKPEIFGLDNITVDTPVSFAAVSSDIDRDMIKFTFDWGDGTIDESDYKDGYRLKGASFTHSWKDEGEYKITVTVSDNQSTSSNEMTINVIDNTVDYIIMVVIGIVIIGFASISIYMASIKKVNKKGKK